MECAKCDKKLEEELSERGNFFQLEIQRKFHGEGDILLSLEGDIVI